MTISEENNLPLVVANGNNRTWEEIVLQEYYKERMEYSKITKNMNWNQFTYKFSWMPKEVIKQLIEFCKFQKETPYQHFFEYFGKHNLRPSFTWQKNLNLICNDKKIDGFFVHMWNNIGRVLQFNKYEVVSF